MVASDGKAVAQTFPYVRYWHKADIPKPPINVRFRGQSGHAITDVWQLRVLVSLLVS